MKAIVSPSQTQGTVNAPASKSDMQRACAAALIKHGKTVLYNPGISADDQAALNIIQNLGASVTNKGDEIIIVSNGIHPVSSQIDCGESGLSFRMFTSIAAVSKEPITVTGTGSLRTRPQSFFTEVLPQLGVQCESNNGLLPLKIQGPLNPKNITIDGSLSSQFLTGLLFAYAAAGARGVTIHVKNLASKPYIDLTYKTFAWFWGHGPENHNYESFTFPDNAPTVVLSGETKYWVEGDWSGAAFLLVAGAVSGNVVIKGLHHASVQADKAILQVLVQSGAALIINKEQLEVSKSNLDPFHFDATDCPDLFPPLVALAAYCDGISTIKGIRRLIHKESNRAQTLQVEFGKMGLVIELQNDRMIVYGGASLNGATVSSHHDHRIAMALAIAALGADAPIVIDDAEAVDKSYPQFWDHLKSLGASVILTNKD